MKKNKCVSIIIPVYNEEDLIRETHDRIKSTLEKIKTVNYELIFVNDGSTDHSLQILKQLYDHDSKMVLINFSKNFGHQNALTAGLDYADGDAIVFIDADLQDPPEVIQEMIEKWQSGYDVVYGVRIHRKGENIFKKTTASFFYRMLNFLSDTKIPVDTGDFRLMSRKVVEAVKKLEERDRYLRGMVAWVGFPQASVYYERNQRISGKTKYSFKKMSSLALNAIISFSTKPLKIAVFIGILMSSFSFIYLIYILYIRFVLKTAILGWASIALLVTLFSGINLIFLGIIGNYIGSIVHEVKKRPIYLIESILPKSTK